MKTLKQQAEEVRMYLKGAKQYRCMNCNAGFLRLRKIKCPLCDSKAIIKEN